jgi:RNA polymerase sigma-70 factor (ECF subfamily)
MLSSSYRRNNLAAEVFLSRSRKPESIIPVSDEEMLDILYRNHAAELLFVILKIIPQIETAEDVLHDTFMKITAGIHLYKSERSQLLTWSKAIARNTAVDYLRLKSSRNNRLNQSIEFSQAELGSNHACCFNPDRIGLKQLCRLLTSEQRMILELFYYKGYTHEEVAETLNIPLGTIKTRIRTSILRLRKYF